MAEQHLDLDGLADLLAVGTPEHDAHLQTCATCRTRLAELQAAFEPVSASLAALPLPPAPADLDSRLSSAVDRLRASAQPAAAKASRAREVRPARKASWMPLAVGLATAAALVTGVVLVNGKDKPTSDSGAAPEAASPHASSSGLSYGRDGKLLAAELPALLNGTAAVAADKALTSAPARNGAQSPGPVVAAADPLSRLHTTSGLASCITALTEGGAAQLPLALDYASFEKQPALVVVLASSKAEKVDVFVVGAGCAQPDAQLLYFARLPAPS